MQITQTAVAGTMESSDIMITLEPLSNGIEIELQSMVEKQFGRKIRQVITETLADLQVSGARVSAVDKGALDCTIQARVKTAVYRGAGNTAYQWKVPQ
jgi:citrate lyase subunit gamma (acyl carrier protein)